MVVMHVWFIGLKGHSGEIAGKGKETSLSPLWVFLLGRNSRVRFWGLVLWYLWIGRAKNPGPAPPHHVAVEVFNVEHRLIPARVRSEWATLRVRGGLHLGTSLPGFLPRR